MEEAEKEAEATRQAIKRKIAQAAVTDFQMRSLPAKLRIEPNDPDDLVLITYIHTATSQVIKALCVFCKQIFQFVFLLVVPNLLLHCFSELVFCVCTFVIEIKAQLGDKYIRNIFERTSFGLWICEVLFSF